MQSLWKYISLKITYLCTNQGEKRHKGIFHYFWKQYENLKKYYLIWCVNIIHILFEHSSNCLSIMSQVSKMSTTLFWELFSSTNTKLYMYIRKYHWFLGDPPFANAPNHILMSGKWLSSWQRCSDLQCRWPYADVQIMDTTFHNQKIILFQYIKIF